MSETTERTGSCICGAITLTAKAAAATFGACHCETCRTWGGGPLLAIECGSNVEVSGEDALKVYDSSAWAERGFCGTCGTHLFYRLKETQSYHVPASLLMGADYKPAFTSQVFIDKKPESYAFVNETKNLTGEELFALFAPKA